MAIASDRSSTYVQIRLQLKAKACCPTIRIVQLAVTGTPRRPTDLQRSLSRDLHTPGEASGARSFSSLHPRMSRAVAAKPQLVRLLIAASKAAPTPPVGPALGARGVRSMDFCKEFNARTAHISPGVPIPTVITIQPDRSFTFVTKTPTVSYFLKKAACIEKGTGRPGHETVGTVSLKHVYEIAKIKATDEHLKHLRLEAIASTIIGSARTLGVQVVP
ncbi:ribosomal protein L11, RNA binding domain-containing protein [Russula brevipes]|nr:ribosomal protein L11, RNA binding domain-containing protein [Russula brevipes]